ncbi:P-loop containing nucleoside triphosphate hydrolase protein [Aspergillus ellipticus CBS 707.79]|uniref:P-loop containing nucleoside triphosphate hydrolase protein n=1 Tax=Aspergillus ellipticus CBS 707.79 TaxID=1448320 RepID=A0A319D2Y3_9EURO|nr:P-loop containing nucleoside triphosphate hydrolase protein [Aspergillus ellipticus CBS 707.79]
MTSQGICREFARSGKCRFRPCRFSHSPPEHDQAIRTPERKPAPSNSEREFRAWKRHIPKPLHPSPLGSQLARFFREGRRLIDLDVGVLQEVVRSLASEGGLRRVQELIEGIRDSWPASLKSTVFLDRVLPFLNIITHPGVLNSLILEQAVGTIYTFLYGIAGRGATELLTFLADVVQSHQEPAAESTISHLEISLLVFWHVIELNPTAFVNDALIPLAERFKALMEEIQGSQTQSALYNVRLNLDRILRRLKIGHSLPAPANPEHAAPTLDRALAEFNINRAPPGGRHDNDSADIWDIKVLPTSEEILSPHTEYLPVKDPWQWHIGGIPGLLDRNFRLLREDTVGQLRDAIHALLRPATNAQRGSNQARTYAYPNVTVTNLSFHRHAGLQFVAQFRQPPQTQRLNARQREEWWQQSRRLQGGALVCLADSDDNVLFCTASKPPRAKKPGEERPKDNELQSLSKNKDTAAVALDLIEPSSDEVQYILNRYRPRESFPPLTLVEFPGIILPAFAPTLRALQQMIRSDNLPFSTFLAPVNQRDAGQGVRLPPPAYAMKPGFSFDLSCLMTDQTRLQLRPGQALDIKKLQEHSTLDDAQAVALVNTLQRSIGLIQGPPGTGKSFTGVALIKVLLANGDESKADIGPIICVCYTNHALDQLLEDVLEQKITTQVVRIGSRCQSEIVSRYSLRKLMNTPARTRAERSSLWELTNDLKGCQDRFDNLRLQYEGSEGNLKYFLQKYNPRQFSQLFGRPGDGDVYVPAAKPKHNAFQHWVKAGPKSKAKPRPMESLREADLHHMTAEERQLLYQDWLEMNKNQLHDEIKDIVGTQRDTKREFDDIRNEVDLRCLHEAQVIGVTTSGLARNLRMLQCLRPKVVLCEEAGEVLEAHILTALLPSVEHAILIGDHMQLRPQIQDYNLSRENHEGGEQYSLDKSLFERLVDPDDESSVQIPFCTLETQRRMHPSIARLIRDTLYPRLEDAPPVLEYPEVSGMRRRLFWLDHGYVEGNVSDADALGTSHWNAFEIEMTTALVTHLLRQGSYKDGDIAVLTPYLGQLHRLRQRLSESVTIVVGERDQDDLENAGLDVNDGQAGTPITKTNALRTVRAATIDNFQGEEAKVVVISLVRSNPQKRCGFLRTSNRINVLLSRAKHGMYVIGNSATSGHVPMWRQVVDILKENGNFGTSLELQCPRHPDSPILVSNPNHFVQYSPEGGCDKCCVNRLRCGHACKQKCHSTLLHDAVYCQKPCPRPQNGCEHICPKLCGDVCPHRCPVKVFQAGRTLKCGHAAEELPCWQSQDPSAVLCPVSMERKVPGCNHTVIKPCHVDVKNSKFKCVNPCGVNLPCGHTCKRLCWNCTVLDQDNNSHVLHVLPAAMFNVVTQCAPTSAASLAPLVLRTNVFHAAPTALRKTSRVWSSVPLDIRGRVVDFILSEAYREINLDENPCIFPRCGHFLTMESMDGQMGMKEHYKLDAAGRPIAIALSSEPFAVEGIKRCATCRGSLRDISRYGRLVRRAILDEATKKFILYINNEYVPMAQELSGLVAELPDIQGTPSPLVFGSKHLVRIDGSRDEQIKLLAGLVRKHSASRWRELIKLRERMVKYYNEVKVEEQPFSRVRALVQRAQQLKAAKGAFQFNESVLQTKGVLLATALLMRLDVALLGDFLSLYERSNTAAMRSRLFVNFQSNRDECRALTGMAKDLDRVVHQVEGYIFLAQLFALQRPHTPEAEAQKCLVDGKRAVASARYLCRRYPAQTNGLLEEVDSAEAMLNGGTFYTAVSNEERMGVVTAMAREFLGTGHWYYCPNGHPFTIGECGGAMQQSRCPECGAAVGGPNHRTAERVMRADDLERGLEHLVIEEE